MTTAPSRPGQAAARAAGIVTRTLAAAVDAGVVVAMMGGTLVLIAGVRFFVSPTSFRWPSPSWDQSLAVGALLAVAYLTVGWATLGRSFGGAVLGLRVRSRGGRPLGWLRSFVRAALYVVFPVGLLWCGISRGRLSLQDLLLRSVVVYDDRRPVIRNG
jgi:uncharacterized RDD family membrane protein YckC